MRVHWTRSGTMSPTSGGARCGVAVMAASEKPTPALPDTLDAAITAGQQSTRRYAKRQYTWLAHQPPAAWPRLDQ